MTLQVPYSIMPSLKSFGVISMESAFARLQDFIEKRMRMSHIYQPLLLKMLLRGGGKASVNTTR